MATRSTSISDLLNQIREEELVLPDLQRDFVWDPEQMRLFFDSVMRDYPFGSMLIWETQYHEVLYRPFVADYKPGMSFVPKVKEAGRRRKMVLDGQQRLQTLYIGAYGSFDGRRLYFNIVSGPGDADGETDDGPSGSYRFEFRQDNDARRPKYLVRVADVIQWDRRHEEDDIKDAIDQAGLNGEEADRAARNLRNLRRVFTQSDIVPLETVDEDIVNARQARSIDEVLEIFVRVNSGGTRLSRSDLMFSLIKSKWTGARVNFDEVIRSVDPDGVVGIDKDFLIRGLLVNSDLPVAFEVDTISRYWDIMELQFDKFSAALKSVLDFCRDPDVRVVAASLLQPAASLYPLIYYAAKQKNCSVRDQDRQALKTLLYMLLFNRFVKSKSPEARIRWLREALQGARGTFPLQQCLEVIRRRQTWTWMTTSVEMLNSNQTLALNIVQPSVCRRTYAWQAKPELDHIFPFSLYWAKYSELVNDIGNKAFLGKLRNIRKSNQLPGDYFAEVSDADLDRDFLVDRRLLADDKFEEFVTSRRARIVAGVTEFLGR
ncbi:MAG: DUF262 domain-containing protein [Steroidobacteraceae bacterium]